MEGENSVQLGLQSHPWSKKLELISWYSRSSVFIQLPYLADFIKYRDGLFLICSA